MNEAYVIPFYAIIEDIQRVTREKDVRLATLQEALQWSLRSKPKRARPCSEGLVRRNTFDTMRERRLNQAPGEGDKDRTSSATVQISEYTMPTISSRPSFKAASSSIRELTDVEAENTMSTVPQTQDPVHKTAARPLRMKLKRSSTASNILA